MAAGLVGFAWAPNPGDEKALVAEGQVRGSIIAFEIIVVVPLIIDSILIDL